MSSERRYRIRGGRIEEKITCVVPIVVAQTQPVEKPRFFAASLTYGDMSRESADQLTKIVDTYRAEVAKALGLQEVPVELDVEGDYDVLMVVQQMTAQLVNTLAQLGFAYAKEKGIPLPRASKLSKDTR